MSHGTGPFAELTRLQNELNRIFAALLESGQRTSGLFGEWDPPMDVIDGPASVRIFLEVPGVKLESLTIRARGSSITVTGTREPDPSEASERRFLCLERSFGPFQKVFSITESVNTHRGTAILESGVLRLEFPKVPDLRSREVTISVTAGEAPPSGEEPAGRPHSRSPRKTRQP